MSLPSLKSKKSSSVSRARSLLEFIQAKEFSFGNFRTSNKVVHSPHEADSNVITNINVDNCDQLKENGVVASNNNSPATHTQELDEDTLINNSAAALMDNRTDHRRKSNEKRKSGKRKDSSEGRLYQ